MKYEFVLNLKGEKIERQGDEKLEKLLKDVDGIICGMIGKSGK